MKTILFVPGFKEDMKSRHYKSTIKAFESSGYKMPLDMMSQMSAISMLSGGLLVK